MSRIIPYVYRSDDEGTVLVRDGITLAYFMPPPLAATVDAVRTALDKYLLHVNPRTLRWASVGADAEEFRPLTPKAIERSRAMLTPESARKRDLTAFKLQDGDTDGDAPTNGVFVIGNPLDAREPRESNLVQFCFPSSMITSPESADSFVHLALELSAGLQVRYGYASPALQWAEVAESEALLSARRHALRYPGFDVSFNEVTRSDLGGQTRGARWLTWLGPELVRAVGGMAKIGELAKLDIYAVEVEGAVLLRAGRVPEIGDRNRGIGTPRLDALASLLHPVTLFQEPALLHSGFADDDPEVLERWELRFLATPG